jgi:hypothetical protein
LPKASNSIEAKLEFSFNNKLIANVTEFGSELGTKNKPPSSPLLEALVKMAGWRQILSSMSLYIVLHPG